MLCWKFAYAWYRPNYPTTYTVPAARPCNKTLTFFEDWGGCRDHHYNAVLYVFEWLHYKNVLSTFVITDHIYIYFIFLLILSAVFTNFGWFPGLLIWITRENANYVIMMKRLSSGYDSPKHISFIITEVQITSGPLGQYMYVCVISFFSDFKTDFIKCLGKHLQVPDQVSIDKNFTWASLS